MSRFEHVNGPSPTEMFDECNRQLIEAHLSLSRIHNWLGGALRQRRYRGDFCDCEELIEDAYAESAEIVRRRHA